MRLLVWLSVFYLPLCIIFIVLALLISPLLPRANILTFIDGRKLLIHDIERHLDYVLDTSGWFERFFVWSPDGARLALLHREYGLLFLETIGKPFLETGRWGVPMAWSPDSTQLAFIPLETPDPELYLLRPDGSLIQKIEGVVRQAAWAGNTALTYFRQDSGLTEIFQVDLSTRQSTLLNKQKIDPDYLAVSPDGKWLAFVSYLNANADIFIVDTADPATLRQLTDSRAHDIAPGWSPDGTQIAYVSANDYANLYLLNLETGENRALTHEDAWTIRPIWSPDGRFIAYLTGAVGDVAVTLMVLDTLTGQHIPLRQGLEWTAIPAWRP